MSDHEQTNGKPALSPGDFRIRLEAIMRDMAELLAQVNGEGTSMNGTGDRMLTVAEVGERLGLKPNRVYKEAARWPFTRKLGHRTLRFSEAGLERWIAERAEPAVEGNGR